MAKGYIYIPSDRKHLPKYPIPILFHIRMKYFPSSQNLIIHAKFPSMLFIFVLYTAGTKAITFDRLYSLPWFRFIMTQVPYAWISCRKYNQKFSSSFFSKVDYFKKIQSNVTIIFVQISVWFSYDTANFLRNSHNWHSIVCHMIWVRSRRCGCLVTWFCYQMLAKPGNKTAAPSWPDPYNIYKIDFIMRPHCTKYCICVCWILWNQNGCVPR